MKKYVRSIASMIVIGVFLILGLSCNCIWDDCFGDSDIPPCDQFHNPFIGTSQIHIHAVDGEAIDGYANAIEGVNLIVTVEKFRVMKEEDKCKLVLKEKFTRELVTNISGLAFFNDYNEFRSPGDKNVITVKASRWFYQSNATQFIKRDIYPNTIKINLVANLLFP